MKRMSYPGRFVRPFAQQLADYPVVRTTSLENFRRCGRAARVDRVASHETLLRWVRLTDDPDLGLKAGRLLCFGEGGVLDFALHSAQSLREACEVACRYAQLYGDGLEIALEVSGARAVLRLDGSAPRPRVVTDFILSAWYAVHLRTQLIAGDDLECWFAYEAPENVAEHARIFAPAQVKFGMRCNGFAFDARHLDEPLASADATLHVLHRTYLSSLAERLVERRRLAPRVHQLLADQMRRGRPTANAVAQRLKVSRRTLSRRLELEDTSFKTILDQLRRELAVRFVMSPDARLGDISSLLGFSRVQGFYRAFQRWTGLTPRNYRRAHGSPLAQAEMPLATS